MMAKYKVTVEEIRICYYIVEADCVRDAEECYFDYETTSSKPKQDEVISIKEVK